MSKKPEEGEERRKCMLLDERGERKMREGVRVGHMRPYDKRHLVPFTFNNMFGHAHAWTARRT